VQDPADAPAVELVGITKQFPGVLANDDISLTVQHGEVHCLLGENGAGKSTLISILSGMVRPDAGEIRVGGKVAPIDSPRDALELGIGTVYQHSTLVRALTVLENLLLGETRGLRLNVEAARARLAEVAATLGVQIDADAPAGELAEVVPPVLRECCLGDAVDVGKGGLGRGVAVGLAVERDQLLLAVLLGEQPAGQPGRLVLRAQGRILRVELRGSRQLRRRAVLAHLREDLARGRGHRSSCRSAGGGLRGASGRPRTP